MIELGMELMVQLTVLTGIQFSSPTGIIGQYNHGESLTHIDIHIKNISKFQYFICINKHQWSHYYARQWNALCSVHYNSIFINSGLKKLIFIFKKYKWMTEKSDYIITCIPIMKVMIFMWWEKVSSWLYKIWFECTNQWFMTA